MREIWRAITGREPASALRRDPAEAPGSGAPVGLEPPRRRTRVLVVPGIYGACVAWLARPFGDAVVPLRARGWEVGYIPVEPRSSSGRNARLIRRHLDGLKLKTDERVVLVGYSKGLADIMEATALGCGLDPGIEAVIGVGGSAFGSPVAASLPTGLKNLLDRLVLPGCPPGDMGAIDSLKPDVRRAWFERHGLPENVRWFSIVALPERARLSRVLRLSYQRIARTDPLNDSQMIARDALIPDSTLLAVVNADHWAMAMPITASASPVGGVLGRTLVDQNAYPRAALLEAALRYVDETLAVSV